MPSEQESAPIPIPQIDSRTGVSRDYINEINGWYMHAIQLYEKKIINADQALENLAKPVVRQGKLMRRYEERFAPPRYQPPTITEQSRWAIEKINALAERVNADYSALLASADSPSEKVAWFGNQTKQYLAELISLISGSEA